MFRPAVHHADHDLLALGHRVLRQKAKDLTYKAPGGQLHGRAGRRCVLEDGAYPVHGQQCSSPAVSAPAQQARMHGCR